MKRGKWISCPAATAAIILTATLLALAAQPPPETVIIKPSIWKTFTRPPVTFSHKKHVTKDKIACSKCHMIYENGMNVWKEGDRVERCEKCHNEPTTRQVYNLTPTQKKLNLELAFHNLCLPCHRKIKSRNPATNVPIVCAGCHRPVGKKEDR